MKSVVAILCTAFASGENIFDGAAKHGFIRRLPDDSISKETGKLSEASARMSARAMQQNQDNLKAVAQLQDKSARELKLDRMVEEGVIHAKTRANQRREMAWLEEMNQTRLAEGNKGESAADAQKRMEAMDVQLTQEAEHLALRQEAMKKELAKVRKSRDKAQKKALQIKAAEAHTLSEFQKKIDLVRQKQSEQVKKAQSELALVSKEEERVIARGNVIGAEVAAARKKAEAAAAAEAKARQEEAAKDLADWEKHKSDVTKQEAGLANSDVEAAKQAKMKAAFKQWAGYRVSETKAEGMADRLSKLKGAERMAEDVEKENVKTLEAIKANREAMEARKRAKVEVAAREEAAKHAEEAELSDPEAEADAQREAEAFLKERRALKKAMAKDMSDDNVLNDALAMGQEHAVDK